MKSIPNVLTLANAALGCCALFLLQFLDFNSATFCVFLAAAFDFFDGFIARIMGWTSRFGAELDSLADMISFGVVPGALATVILTSIQVESPWIFLGFIITLASAYRLAKYNTSTNNQAYFRGLPTPANALLWIGIPPLNIDLTFSQVLAGIVITSFLLNSSLVFYRLPDSKTLAFCWTVLLIILFYCFFVVAI